MVWNKLTHDEFVSRVIEKNQYVANGDIVILGEYVDNHSHIKCRCNIHNIIWDSTPTSLYSGCGCKQCGCDKAKVKRLTSHDVFLQKLAELNSGIIAAGQYINMTTPMDFQCRKGHVWLDEPTDIIRGKGCPYCSNARVLTGYNDIWTTRPDVAQILKNKNDGYKYTSGSNKKVDFICPECGSISNKSIVSVSTRGLCCQVCADGISYPNKFIRQVLKQLKINFIPEYNPSWAKPRKYDCYFEYNGQKYIIEMDGAFHYMDRQSIKKTAVESHAIDELKTQLANQHDIEVIRIESLESNVEYIKNKILSSKLNDILDLLCVDWDLCDANAQKSLVKNSCDLYMSGIHDVEKIGTMLNIHSATVRNYLKLGVKFGWCDYSDLRFLPIVVIDDNCNVLHSFESCALCSREMQRIYGICFGQKYISQACQTHKPYKGFNFRFANETIQN